MSKKLKDIEGLLPEKKGLAEKIKKGTCDTCEHEGSSSAEHCGTCGCGNTLTSSWKEAGWIKEKKLSEIGEKELEIDVERAVEIAEKVPCNIHMLHNYRRDIVQAIADAFPVRIKEVSNE